MKKQRFIKAIFNAVSGIVVSAGKERNFIIQLIILLMVIAMGFVFSITPVQWMMIAGCSSMVLSLELINTALEKLANVVTAEYHPVIKQVKDTAAGAVLIASVASIIIGLIIFIPEIKKLL